MCTQVYHKLGKIVGWCIIVMGLIVTVHSLYKLTLCLGSIGMDSVISESCYKRAILQRTDRKMTITWSFSYNSFVKFYGRKN